MTRHGPTVLLEDEEFGPLISIGAEEEPMSVVAESLSAELDKINQRVNRGIGEGSLAAARWRDALIDVGVMLDDLINDDLLARLESADSLWCGVERG